MSPNLRHTPPLTAAEQECAPGAEHRQTRILRLGTRGSTLATTQAGHVADALRALGHDVELVEVRTEGDVNGAPLTQIGGSGVFASALRTALREDHIDIAVHSLKDLPTAPEDGLMVAAVPVREDPRDVVITRGAQLADLPQGALVGTGSPRRAAQLQLLAPQVSLVDIRGNVGTRITKVLSGEVDATILAAAGLNRLGRMSEATQTLEFTEMLPAPGQGALAVECRSDDAEVVAACTPLNDQATYQAVTAERALLARLEAGCTAPIGALAQHGEHGLHLEAFLAHDGVALREAMTGLDPSELGKQFADSLLKQLPTPVDLAGDRTTATERDS